MNIQGKAAAGGVWAGRRNLDGVKPGQPDRVNGQRAVKGAEL